LFCVVFAIPGVELPELVNESMKFSLELLKLRVRFEQTHGLPQGIDIGLAAGVATIGMFGPMGQVKATAFGETPGRSRRIQTVGKILRYELGDSDRVIFGHDVARYCRGNLRD